MYVNCKLSIRMCTCSNTCRFARDLSILSLFSSDNDTPEVRHARPDAIAVGQSVLRCRFFIATAVRRENLNLPKSKMLDLIGSSPNKWLEKYLYIRLEVHPVLPMCRFKVNQDDITLYVSYNPTSCSKP